MAVQASEANITWERARECERHAGLAESPAVLCCGAAPGHTWELSSAAGRMRSGYCSANNTSPDRTFLTEWHCTDWFADIRLFFGTSSAIIICLVSGETIKNIYNLILHKTHPVFWVVFAEEIAFRKKRLCIKFIPRDSTEAAICDIRILGRSKQAPPQYTFIG